MLAFIGYLFIVLGFIYVAVVTLKHLNIMYYNVHTYRNNRKDYMEDTIFTVRNILIGIGIFVISMYLASTVNPSYTKGEVWNTIYDVTRDVFVVSALTSCVIAVLFRGYLHPNTFATSKTFKTYLFTKMGMLFAYNMLVLPVLFICFLAIYLR